MNSNFQQRLKQVLSLVDEKSTYEITIDDKLIIKGGNEFKLYLIVNAKHFTDEAWSVLLSLEQSRISKPKKKKNGNL